MSRQEKVNNSNTTKKLENKPQEERTVTLNKINFVERLESYLGDSETTSILVFSETCNAARKLTDPWRLLRAVVNGEESAVKSIINSNPELLLDKSTIVTGFLGKKIKNQTPLQAALYAWDEDMLKIMLKVLREKGPALKIDPELEIQRQFKEVYPDGIESVVAAQKVCSAPLKMRST